MHQVGDDTGENKEEGKEEEDDAEVVQNDSDRAVEKLLGKFLIGTESAFLDDINIILMMKALPNKISEHQILKQMKLINFSILQDSLIAFQYSNQVQSFEYFDNYNKQRVQKIRTSLMTQKDDLLSVYKILKEVSNYVRRNNDILGRFKGIWEDFNKAT